MLKLLSKMTLTKIYSATTVFSEKGPVMKRENRPCWAIILKYEGETVYRCGEQTVISNMENMVVLPRGSSYIWQCVEAGHFMALEFQCDRELKEILSFPVTEGEEILKLMRGIERKRLAKNPLYELECVRDTYSILLKLAETQVKKYIPGDRLEKLTPAYEYMLLHYTEPLSCDMLASLAGMSDVYFRRVFKNTYGLPPLEFLKKLKMKKAKEMLRGDYSSITDIALSLGYPNIYDFSRDFKKHLGMPPTEYSKSQK